MVVTASEGYVVVRITLVVNLTDGALYVHVGLLVSVQFSVKLEGRGKLAKIVVAQNLLQVQSVYIYCSAKCLVGSQVHGNLCVACSCLYVGLQTACSLLVAIACA